MATYDERNKRHNGTEHTRADSALGGATRHERRLSWLRETTGSGTSGGTSTAGGEAWDGASGGGEDRGRGSGGSLDGGGAGNDDDLAVGGGEDDLGNGDLGGDGGDGEGGLSGSASWLAGNGDGSLDNDGGHWAGVGLGGLNGALVGAVGDDTGVGGDVWGADTLEELGGLVDLGVGGSEGGQALEEVLGEVGLGAEAGDVGVGLAAGWEPGLDALGKDRWAGKSAVTAWGGGGGLGRSDGGVDWLGALGGSWLSDIGGDWLGTLGGGWLWDGIGVGWDIAGLDWASWLGAGALGAEGLGGGEDDGGGGQGGLDGGKAGVDVGEGDWARGDGDIGDDGGEGDLGLSLSGGWGLDIGGPWCLGGGGGLDLSGLDGGGLSGGLGLDIGGHWWGGLWGLSGGWGSSLDSWCSSGSGLDSAGSSSGVRAVESDAVDADAAGTLSSLGWLGVDDGHVLGATALGVLDGGTGLLAARLLLADGVVGEGVVELEVAVELDGNLEVGDGELVDRAGLDLGAAGLVAVGGAGPWEEGITLAATEGGLAVPSAGEVKASVVVERSEVQVSPGEARPLVRLTLVDGGLAWAREDRSVVPSLWYVRCEKAAGEHARRTVATTPWRLAATATRVARDWDFMLAV
ncbi:hypothetical protein V501_09435 [Pseudogymnoascus sp. VKM F-4519 (FW-2642)]|nr:hypothetical protein V501_09435 [Pseudogymnoascus sp. VKM F-4519 (FW-2642)]